MENLDWMVAVNLWDTETSSFWQRPGVDPTEIKTEVFLLPVAASIRCADSIAASRWMMKCWPSTLSKRLGPTAIF